MFGILRVPKGLLTEAEDKIFQGHYCAVCYALGRCGSPVLRMSTSYDAAALAMLATGLCSEEMTISLRPCPVKPWRKIPVVTSTSEVFEFAARATLGLISLKIYDELEDGGLRLKRLVLQLGTKYLQRKLPAWDEFAVAAELQSEIERVPQPWFDEAAYPSGYLLGSIASRAAMLCGREADNAYVVGENLGKWIYTWDGLWDFESDLRKGRFNPLVSALGSRAHRVRNLEARIFDQLEFVLERTLSETIQGLQIMKLGANGEILVKMLRGVHLWHRQAFVKEYFKEEYNECLPSSWRNHDKDQSAAVD